MKGRAVAGSAGLSWVRHLADAFRRLPRLLLLSLVQGYQLVISPWTAPSCRYHPSCSQYAMLAIRRHGALRGGWLAARRLGRCHPWSAGGVDDVPAVVNGGVRRASGKHGQRSAA